jgi:hypothetical protein
MHSHVDLILESRWQRLKKHWGATDVEKETFANRLYDTSTVDRGVSFLNPWLSIFDEACFWLKLERDFVMAWSKEIKAPPIAGVFLLIHKALTEALSFRLLIISGYEDSAEVIFRSMMESLDVSLLLLTDRPLADAYWGEWENESDGSFWKKYLSKGRTAKRFQALVERLSGTRGHLSALGPHRTDVFSKLSERIHSSLRSSVASFAHPSLERPGMYSISPFGRLGARAPTLVTVAYDYIGFHGDMFIASIIENAIAFDLDVKKREAALLTLVARWNLLQEVAHLFERDRKRLERVLK